MSSSLMISNACTTPSNTMAAIYFSSLGLVVSDGLGGSLSAFGEVPFGVGRIVHADKWFQHFALGALFDPVRVGRRRGSARH